MNLFDAHCHLQDPRLAPHLAEYLATCQSTGIKSWMVNATRQSDWENVAALAHLTPGILPSFGLHPWWQIERSPDWATSLEQILQRHPNAGIGETGLDRWMPEHNIEDQISVLETHLELAKKLHRPVSLHCLKAWPELKSVIKRFVPLPQGFLLHSYAGPPEMTDFWIQAGAYFSFSPAFIHPRKLAQRMAFETVPLDRLLIESDSPDMPPPRELELHSLLSPTGEPLNHPANLHLCLKALAYDRGVSATTLAESLESNFIRLFGNPTSSPQP